MNSPKVFFSSPLVKAAQVIIDPKGSWYGCTVPEGVPEACAKLALKTPPMYKKLKKLFELLSKVKAGIYFTEQKSKIKKYQFKHECYHWSRGQEMGGANYFALLGGQYLIYGHGNAPEEKAADKYGKSGDLDTFEQTAWDASV